MDGCGLLWIKSCVRLNCNIDLGTCYLIVLAG